MRMILQLALVGFTATSVGCGSGKIRESAKPTRDQATAPPSAGPLNTTVESESPHQALLVAMSQSQSQQSGKPQQVSLRIDGIPPAAVVIAGLRKTANRYEFVGNASVNLEMTTVRQEDPKYTIRLSQTRLDAMGSDAPPRTFNVTRIPGGNNAGKWEVTEIR